MNMTVRLTSSMTGGSVVPGRLVLYPGVSLTSAVVSTTRVVPVAGNVPYVFVAEANPVVPAGIVT